jgi:outer membrane protein assembly factor BamB
LAGIYVSYNEDAPETAHILWTKPYAIGGLAGGALGGHGYEDGDAYQGYGDGSVIVNGIYIYNDAPNPTGWGAWDPQWNKITAVDLHTGEELWSKSFGLERVAFAQEMLWDAFNNHGAFAYFYTTIGSTWKAYDPRTGQWVFTLENVPSGARVERRTTRGRGPKGEILIYEVDTDNGWMALWNSTNVPALYGADVHPSNPEYNTQRLLYTVWGNWWPWNKTVDATGPVEVSPQQPLGKAGYSWNVTIPTGLPGSVAGVSVGNKLVGVRSTSQEVSSWALSLEKGHEGALLYSNTWQAPTEWEESNIGLRHLTLSFEDDVFVIFAAETRTWYGFDMSTGDFLWKGDSQVYLDHYQYVNHAAFGYGNLLSVSIGGIVYCYDARTGTLKWTYEVTDPFNEFNWGDNWAMMTNFVTDGKIYMGQEMHSPIDPKPRGAPYVCLDAVTGDVVWRADGMFRQTEWGGHAIIGDSVMVTMDTYDNRLYGVGKGPSEITVEAPLTASAWGQKIVLRGTVMDISPGTQTDEMKMRFPKGVPAVSDGDMSAWMRYVYKQFSCPMASGVPVKLEVVVDPNGNWYDIGTAYTDASGFYKISWEPPVPGEYLILASFAGSEAYYGSYVETAIVVDESPSPGTLMETEFLTSNGTGQSTTASVISTEVAIFAVVAIASIIGLAAYSLIRKK